MRPFRLPRGPRPGLCWLLVVALSAACAGGQAEMPESTTAAEYYPEPGQWERRSPAQLGMDPALVQQAVAYASTHDAENVAYDFSTHEATFGTLEGPMPESRGGPAGLIVRDGYIVAEWGDTERPDLTFSVTKSFVSTMVGLALDAGLIEDVNDPIGRYVRDGSFDSPHNQPITWQQLLQQTSEWEGTLFGKSDTADFYHRRNRTVGRQAPGTHWEYNDIRVNLAAYGALRLWERPLPEVFEERVMDPIGASDSWQWHGYPGISDVEIGGRTVTSVSGGGHWGGGLWISAEDMARFGLLFLRGGEWEGEQLISERWIDLATTPTDIQPNYGYMWWLDPDSAPAPGEPVTSYSARGYGGNTIWIDETHDLVVVTRWFGGEWSHFRDLLLQAVAASPTES